MAAIPPMATIPPMAAIPPMEASPQMDAIPQMVVRPLTEEEKVIVKGNSTILFYLITQALLADAMYSDNQKTIE